MEKGSPLVMYGGHMDIREIQSLIKDVDCYEAHILEDDNHEIIKRESLLAHTELTLKYFKYIWNEKRIEEMLDRFCEQVWKDITENARDFLNEMILGIPIFHDLGKINPEFQNRKLQNHRIKNNNVFSCVAGRHSIISSVLYLDYFLSKLKDAVLERKEKKRLRAFLVFHAYIIERHHSDLTSFSQFLESLEQGRGRDIAEIFSDKVCDAWVAEFSLYEKKLRSLVREQDKQFSEICNYGESAGIYAYVKMLYSLLVASDYYATTEFMSGIQMKQLGTLEKIKEWLDAYENTELMKKIRTYQKEEYPQNERKLKCETDINRIRTEMLCDAEKTLKKHPLENLFYLEAPTGSGKSNTAVNLSFQMIKNDERLKKIYYSYYRIDG